MMPAAGTLARACAACLRSPAQAAFKSASERSIAAAVGSAGIPARCRNAQQGRSASTLSAPSSAAAVAAPAPEIRIPLQDWCGADREILVYRSLEDMLPARVEMLPGRVFNAEVRPDFVHRVVHWQLAKRRAGTACTKGRGEVAGSGRKVRPQKGSGRSRQGAITSPIFRGGGVVHGPKPRDYSYPLPHNVRRNALRSALTSKFDNGQLWVIESAALSNTKTKTLLSAVDAIGWRSALIVDDVPDASAGVDESLRLASHNIQPILAIKASGVNVYDLLSFQMVVFTKSALEHIRTRFEKYSWLV